MIFREAAIEDIKEMHVVRNSVLENALSDPALVSEKDYEDFISLRGKGWVCESDQQITGFAIADLKENNIWALFLLPQFEGKGIGKMLHQIMLDWYFSQGKETVWLSTSRGTRAENFYRKLGWRENGIHGKGEIRFELTREQWHLQQK